MALSLALTACGSDGDAHTDAASPSDGATDGSGPADGASARDAAADAAADAASGDGGSGVDPCGPEAEGWAFESLEGTMRWPSLAIDEAGHAHVVYFDEDRVEHATNASGAWENEVIGDGFSKLKHSGVAIDDEGVLHVAFGEISGSRLHYATNGSGSWAVTRDVADAGLQGARARVGIHPDGEPRIVYDSGPNDTTNHLRVARPGAEGWEEEAKFFVYARSTDLHVGPDALHVVSSGYRTTDSINYATDASGEWELERVGLGEQVALTLDPAGNVHFIYARRGGLYHGLLASGATEVDEEALIPEGVWSVGEREVAVVTDDDGSLHAVFTDRDCPVRYATDAAGEWRLAVLPPDGGSMALTIHDGTLHLFVARQYGTLAL